MIDDDWVNIESSNLYEKSKPLHVPSLHVPSLHVPSLHVPSLHQPKPPEIQQMTIVNKSPTESHQNVITHRNVNIVNSSPEYHDMMIPKTISSKHERDMYDCVMRLKEYIQEVKLFLIKCSYCVDSWDDIV